MDKALLDTDIFSEVLKGVDPYVVAQALAYRAIFGRYTITGNQAHYQRIRDLGYELGLDNWR